MLPLGHSTFVGIGAYTSTILSLQYGISPWIGMIIGGCLAVIVGVLIGLPTFKMRGAYFALATIAFAEGIRVMVENIEYLGPFKLNGPRGLQIPPLNTGLANFMFATKEPYYYIILLMLIAVLALTYFISRSKLGYYLSRRGRRTGGGHGAGGQCGPCQADRHGHELVSYRLSPGPSGPSSRSSSTRRASCRLDISFEIAFIALIGGRGSIAGPVLGAMHSAPGQRFLSDLLR